MDQSPSDDSAIASMQKPLERQNRVRALNFFLDYPSEAWQAEWVDRVSVKSLEEELLCCL